MLNECVVWTCLAALLGLGIGGGIAWVLIRRVDRLNLNSAETRASELVIQAEKTAVNMRKDAELQAKDELFNKRDEFNRETEKIKTEQREQERRLEKKEDALEQRHQAQQKKERLLQHNEKKLAERKEALDKRVQDAETLVLEQTKKLHEISGLSREQAEKLLLERLDQELSEEVAVRIHRHEEMLKATTEEKARRVLAISIQRYAAEHTADT
ncbi:MAG TPA: Rnase Y domain-containing protein, partial [Gemmataceae bacterium]|nr:Rnase Y domain-containing protein [Gemmataceae bacterium]